jgi:hypothetical protein
MMSHAEKKAFYAKECWYEALRNECEITAKALEDERIVSALNNASLEQLIDLLRCMEVLTNDDVAHPMVFAFADYVERGILWFPFVATEIAPYVKSEGMNTLIYQDTDVRFKQYVERFENHAVTLLAAEMELGLSEVLRVFSARPLYITPSHKPGFSTAPYGEVFMPQVVMSFDSKEANFESYDTGALHEQSHHRYNSFRVNMHPLTFDYEAAGLKFLRADEENGAVYVQKGDKEYEITKTEHILALSGRPGLLNEVWNIMDDRRVDHRHCSDFPGHKAKYERNHQNILDSDVRGEITNDDKGTMEAFIQVMITGKTKSPIPPEVNKRLESVWKIAGEQVLDYYDATDALNCAIRILPHLPKREKKEEKKGEKGYKGISGNGAADVSEGEMVIEKPRQVGGKEGEDEDEGGSGGRKPVPGEPEGKPEPAPGKEGEEGDGSKEFNYTAASSGGLIRGGWKVKEVQPAGWESVAVPPRVSTQIARVFRQFKKDENALVRGLDSGDPDIELLEAHQRSEDAGIILPPDYYSGVDHSARSVLLTIVLDMSVSMGSGEGSKLMRALSAAKGIEDGALMLKDDVLTMGFASGNPMEICIIGQPGRRIRAPVGISGNTPLGGAIRHAHFRTEQLRRKMGKKLTHMIVLTDGQPNVCPGDDAIYDSTRAVSDARRKGIPVFGALFADSEAEEREHREAYNRIFGYGNYTVLKDIGRLAQVLKAYYRKNLLVQGEVL